MTKWRSIESAPADGRPLLVMKPVRNGRYLAIGALDDYRMRLWKEPTWFNFNTRKPLGFNPEFWAPIPAKDDIEGLPDFFNKVGDK